MWSAALVLLGVVCLSYQTPLTGRVNFDYETEFNNFVQKFERNYKDDSERTFRFNTFVQNVDKMLEYSNKMPTAKFGITKFADWTKEEKSKLNGLPKRTSPMPKSNKLVSNSSSYNLPQSFDWRSRNVVTPVKDQGQCGSCWTFQTTAVIESHVLLSGQRAVSLSEQELIDCDQLDGSNGCYGGWPNAGLVYAVQNGLPTEKAYPYKAVNQDCHARYGASGRTYITNWMFLGPDENAAAYQLMQLGPIGYNIYVPDSLFDYESGVWWPSDADCQAAENEGHAVTIIGFGTENGVPYWLIKNSWGTGWGELGGYFKMYRGDLTCAMGYGIGDDSGDFGDGDEWFVAVTQ